MPRPPSLIEFLNLMFEIIPKISFCLLGVIPKPVSLISIFKLREDNLFAPSLSFLNNETLTLIDPEIVNFKEFSKIVLIIYPSLSESLFIVRPC